MKLRVKYSKMEDARFLSHLELLKAMERAFRRAKIPLAFSEGFNPHPKISYASALSVGTASRGEYLDLELNAEMGLSDFKSRINTCLVKGIEVLDVKEIKGKSKSLTSIIEMAEYTATSFVENKLSEKELQRLIDEFLMQPEIIVNRKSKDKNKEINIKEGIYCLKAELNNEMSLTIRFTVVSGSKGNIRAGEVYHAFITFSDIKTHGNPFFIREDLYTIKNNSLYTPMGIPEG